MLPLVNTCEPDTETAAGISAPAFVVLDPMTAEEDSGGPYLIKNFKGAGLYRLPVSAIRSTENEKRGVAVDSATLLFVDNSFLSDLLQEYEWDKAISKNGDYDWKYHQQIAEGIGTRFGICSTPPKEFKSEFIGDGFYTVDVKGIERMEK